MKSTILILLFAVCCQCTDDFLRKAAKSVPRIGRSGGADYENFFLKASKSVPRIGRRGDSSFGEAYEQWLKQNNFMTRYAKRMDPVEKDLQWSDLAEIVEYNPDLLSSPRIMTRLQAYRNDNNDFKDFDWETARVKRDKEIEI